MIIKDWSLPTAACYYARCEECGEETGCFNSWAECKDWIKRNGWKFRHNKQTGEWEHCCPDCKERMGIE